MPVHHALEGDLCLITLDAPPVNVIGRELREGLAAALDAAEAAGAARIIITGAGAAFAAGADAREFDGPPLPPHLPPILERLERLPAIAAINGTALGGGLEIALACRMRIAAPGAALGLPEVGLGVVPGAGGTQRLPRLVGSARAAALISEGRRITAEDAMEIGLVDRIAPDPLAAARAVGTAALAACIPACACPAPAPAPEAVAAARAAAARRARGQVAPQIALDLVEAAAILPMHDALAQERAQFLALREAPEARALRHLFFAERAAASRARRAGEGAPALRRAVVVGGGTMGAGIAYALDRIGMEVALVETDPAAAARAEANVARLFDEAVQRGKADPAAAAAGRARIVVQAGYDALPPADIAIEAVFEDLAVKRQVFAALDAALPRGAILATNTSYLDLDRIFEGIRAPGRCIGLHFFSPAHVMKLLEIIRAGATAPETLAAGFGLAARLGKIAVEAGNADGFIGNRILTRYRQICDVMLIEGATPRQVDDAMTGFGMAMGPYAVQDLSGLDIAYANRRRQNLRDAPGRRYIPIADRMVEDLGRLGRKSGGGWYDHGAGAPQPSAEAEALIEACAREAGIARRPFSDAEIQERAVAAMIDEGRRILAEGVARRSEDIDLALVHGYGFPRFRGGPMHHAAQIGDAVLRARIAAYAAEDPLSWPPMPTAFLPETEQG